MAIHNFDTLFIDKPLGVSFCCHVLGYFIGGELVNNCIISVADCKEILPSGSYCYFLQC